MIYSVYCTQHTDKKYKTSNKSMIKTHYRINKITEQLFWHLLYWYKAASCTQGMSPAAACGYFTFHSTVELSVSQKFWDYTSFAHNKSLRTHHIFCSQQTAVNDTYSPEVKWCETIVNCSFDTRSFREKESMVCCIQRVNSINCSCAIDPDYAAWGRTVQAVRSTHTWFIPCQAGSHDRWPPLTPGIDIFQ